MSDDGSGSGSSDEDEFYDAPEYVAPEEQQQEQQEQQQDEKKERDEGQGREQHKRSPSNTSHSSEGSSTSEEAARAPPPLPPKPSEATMAARQGGQHRKAAVSAVPPPLPERPRGGAAAAAARAPPPPPPKPPAEADYENMTEEEIMRNLVRNLDTDETCDIRQVDSFFPEVKRAVTLSEWLDQRADAAPAAEQQQQQQQQQQQHEAGAEPQHEEKHGFMSALRSVFRRNYNSMRLERDEAQNAVRVRTKRKARQELADLRLIQDIAHHTGPVWTAKFSPDGNFLATAGQDSIVRVWAVTGSPAAREAEERASSASLGGGGGGGDGDSSSGRSAASSADGRAASPVVDEDAGAPPLPTEDEGGGASAEGGLTEDIPADLGGRAVVVATPYRMFSGHKNDVIDLAWSKSNFLLSASIDKTVRLWHVSRPKCLRLFQHADFVTAVNFHPVEDKYFVSGSFDRKLRIWNITEHAVIEWAQTPAIITAATFSPSGKMAVAGLFDGQVVFYQSEGLKYFTQVDARNRHGKFKKGRKVTSLEYTPDGRRMLVTTNDNRVRLYDMEDFACVVKYKGHENGELQIRASFDRDARHVICGSEDAHVYVWDLVPWHADGDAASGGGGDGGGGGGGGGGGNGGGGGAPAKERPRPERNESYEVFKAHPSTVTTAQFAPQSAIDVNPSAVDGSRREIAHLICTTGYDGSLRFYENRDPPRAL